MPTGSSWRRHIPVKFSDSKSTRYQDLRVIRFVTRNERATNNGIENGQWTNGFKTMEWPLAPYTSLVDVIGHKQYCINNNNFLYTPNNFFSYHKVLFSLNSTFVAQHNGSMLRCVCVCVSKRDGNRRSQVKSGSRHFAMRLWSIRSVADFDRLPRNNRFDT